MEIINNIEWLLKKKKKDKNKNTNELITKDQLKRIVFDDSVNENVKFCFPLNNEFLFLQTRELSRPITVKQILKLIYNFYKEPLRKENIAKAFEGNEEWKENIIDKYNGDITKLTNYDVFNTTYGVPDFCGLILVKATNEYFVCIGPV